MAKSRESEGDSGGESIPAERPFDAVNIFGDLGRSVRLPGTEENKVWWERMVRGEVGKDRFLILCALKNGNWKRLGDIRDFIEFQIHETYRSTWVQEMLVLMSGKWIVTHPKFRPKDENYGEGWLEKSREAMSWGIDSEWRIEPSVLPLLYFLLMGCPEDANSASDCPKIEAKAAVFRCGPGIAILANVPKCRYGIAG